ncbi:OmpA family protein [Sediminitomix flava]|uniref:Outer membrane protein OmpA-like peptidoglycan-associated protein n=1 Tax=Sediminitomix flava TaxID=379075 RepID=A0A315ZBP2_SEDFL|nr:OmpA family protein [Sediminitomix flava]PWJ42134.1 outer membrane protein OmpA-like peptidoglycan-associated protein [Sediminitomix flava]
MKYLQLSFYIFLSCITQSILFAQDVEFTKKNFPDQKEQMKEAVENMKTGQSYMDAGDFDGALEYLFKAQEFNSNNVRLNYIIGISYLYCTQHDKTKALEYLEKAMELDMINPDLDEIQKYLGLTYHYKREFQTAIKHFRRYIDSHGEDELILKKIEECRNGIRLADSGVEVEFINLGEAVNSEYAEYGVTINADQTEIYFTSRRSNSTGGQISGDHHYFEDIYSSKFQNGAWTPASNLGHPINTAEHDASVALSPDGSKMIIYREGLLYESIRKGSQWSEPKKFPETINISEHQPSACYSYDGKKLFFVSDYDKNTHGGLDIFVSELQTNGQWGEAENLGLAINSIYDEDAVYFHPDGKTLYFSSKGHHTIGGYDIFKSTLKHGTWTEAESMGSHINTPGDDIFLSITAKGDEGYIATWREDSYGSKDIYKIDFKIKEEEPVVVKEEPEPVEVKEEVVVVEIAKLILFKGFILDEESQSPVTANITITDVNTNEEITSITSNSETGKFLMPLPSGKDYAINIDAEGYLFHSENFSIEESTEYYEAEKIITLNKIKVGSKIILRNVFFDTNSANLKTESEPELDHLVMILNEHQDLKVEIGGHTDDVGNEGYNQQLSEKRAQSVVSYLIGKGIESSRLVSKGYGESTPIADNTTKDGRALNRRTEFQIIE